MGQQNTGGGGMSARRDMKSAAITALVPVTIALAGGEVRPQGQTAAPPCTLALSTGQPVSFDAFRGQVLYVDFWALWCVLSFPFMNDLQHSFSSQALAATNRGRPERLSAGTDRRPVAVMGSRLLNPAARA
jgi:hypothetical protein